MESEALEFETSEMVGSFLASTPILKESWGLCEKANTAAPMSFVIEEIAGIGYVAFSGVQRTESVTEPGWAQLVALPEGTLFGPLLGPTDHGAPPPMVHSGLLHSFFSMLPFFNQIMRLKERCKSIVITGHSLGGATASFTTLWLLSLNQSSSSSSPSILCITFGSPLIGNEPLGRAILRERWAANFCHVAAKHDVVPRLLKSPPTWPTLHHWQNIIRKTGDTMCLEDQGNSTATTEFFRFAVNALENGLASPLSLSSVFWPFGNYLFCSEDGAICLDDAACIVKMMYLTFVDEVLSVRQCVDDHVRYGDCVARVSLHFMKKRSLFAEGETSPRNTYEAGVALALQSTGIAPHAPAAAPAKECLRSATKIGLKPILNCANLAISLSRVVPHRAQIEWYMASCDKSDDQLGYYDAFKLRGNSKKGSEVNLIRHRLAVFWDGVIEKLEKNELPHDFHTRPKWVNALQFYKLLAEPLDIAEYYRTERHLTDSGHYLKNGARPRRYQISDRWWRDQLKGRGEREKRPSRRTRYASQTQDSCFWARLEEAKEWLDRIRNEDGSMNAEMWEYVNGFDCYARGLVENREVSNDVVARNSSYMKWAEEVRKLRSALIYPEIV